MARLTEFHRQQRAHIRHAQTANTTSVTLSEHVRAHTTSFRHGLEDRWPTVACTFPRVHGGLYDKFPPLLPTTRSHE
jgi:hypothetical protein